VNGKEVTSGEVHNACSAATLLSLTIHVDSRRVGCNLVRNLRDCTAQPSYSQRTPGKPDQVADIVLQPAALSKFSMEARNLPPKIPKTITK
jgi:hypothetical protein